MRYGTNFTRERPPDIGAFLGDAAPLHRELGEPDVTGEIIEALSERTDVAHIVTKNLAARYHQEQLL